MHWLEKFAESYGGGSKGTDFLGTEDGSETLQDTINTDSPSNGEGQGRVPDYGQLNHPITPNGENFHNSDNTYQGLDEHEGQDSDLFVTQPFGEQMVDDNHANVSGDGGLAGYAMLRLLIAKDDESDFFTSPTQGGPADSPQILDDGHADEELQRDTQGVENTINEFDPNTKVDNSWIDSPDIVDKTKSHSRMNDANVWQGSTSFAHLTSRPSLITHIPIKQKAATIPEGQLSKEKLPEEPEHLFDMLQPAPVKGKHLPAHDRFDAQPFDKPSMFSQNSYHWGDDSNVEQTMNPDEEKNLQINKKEDFGNKDYGAQTTMNDSPNLTDENDESKNYSGFNNAASLLDIIMKKADNTAVMPSSNPNSGRGDEDDEVRQTMNDGKPSYVFDNVADKEFNSGDIYQQKNIKYENKTQGPEDYFSLLNSGGNYGLEGDGKNQSGVNNAT